MKPDTTRELVDLIKHLIDQMTYVEADQMNYRLREWVSFGDEFVELRQYLVRHMQTDDVLAEYTGEHRAAVDRVTRTLDERPARKRGTP